MLRNLRAEMSRYNVRAKDFAKLLKVREATISGKMNGKSHFTLNEAMQIKEVYFPHLSLEYLFEL